MCDSNVVKSRKAEIDFFQFLFLFLVLSAVVSDWMGFLLVSFACVYGCTQSTSIDLVDKHNLVFAPASNIQCACMRLSSDLAISTVLFLYLFEIWIENDCVHVCDFITDFLVPFRSPCTIFDHPFSHLRWLCSAYMCGLWHGNSWNKMK